MRIIFLSDGVLPGKTKEMTKEILSEIRKKYPVLYQEAKKDLSKNKKVPVKQF